jgi:hypothetical protein
LTVTVMVAWPLAFGVGCKIKVPVAAGLARN